MRVLARIEQALLAQRGHLFPWAPVCFAVGIGGYFVLRSEPGPPLYAGLACLAASGAALALRWPGRGWSALAWAVALMAAGLCVAGLRAHRVAAPVLPMPHYYGPVEGRVIKLDRSASDALRVTLDRVRLADMPRGARPARVRVSLHGPDPPALWPGQVVMTTARLSRPQGPVEPGGFDFRRHSWFLGLGAVGYTRAPVLTVDPPGPGQGLRLMRARMAASARVRAILPGDTGGFAAAVTTGDRSGVGQAALEALRGSNLAHLLAISGLHMGLLAGFVFATLRWIMAAIPPLALRLPVRKLAATGALMAAAGYLALSGGNVATERAFVMTAVILCAVLVDRRAFSLRAVAMAALIVLSLRPEALTGPGFQMSFAATTALVAVFGALRDCGWRMRPAWAAPVAGVVISSAVAGFATAPVAAAHFNMISHFGLAANLVSVPLMGTLVIPAAVLAALLAPFGLDWIGLVPMGWGLDWILGVAHWISGLEGARGTVVSPPGPVLPLLALGGLWVILWQGRARWAGVAPVLAAALLWVQAERPQVLIDASGGLVGVMTPEGRALSKPRGAGFVAGVWLENDGDALVQEEAAARWPGPGGPVRRYPVGGTEIVHVIGKRGARAFTDCAEGQVVVASVPLAPKGGCRVLDPAALRQTGSLALHKGAWISAQTRTGARRWNPPRAGRAALRDQ